MMETVKKLLSGGEDRKVSIQLLLSLSPPLERGMSEEAAQNKESLLTQLGPRSLQFLLQTASLSLDLKLVWDNPAIQARKGADIPRDFPWACKEKSDTSILHLLSFVFNYKSMVQIAEGCLHRGGGEGNVKAVPDPVADKSCSSCPWCRTPIWGCWPVARCAVSNPDFILQNTITIFNFMGFHLLKVELCRSLETRSSKCLSCRLGPVIL